jgi:hypothetical protein
MRMALFVALGFFVAVVAWATPYTIPPDMKLVPHLLKTNDLEGDDFLPILQRLKVEPDEKERKTTLTIFEEDVEELRVRLEMQKKQLEAMRKQRPSSDQKLDDERIRLVKELLNMRIDCLVLRYKGMQIERDRTKGSTLSTEGAPSVEK